jgi:glutamate-1-semialdehyde 2,1-aminomutase
MIAKGIYLPCSQFEALFFSITHTEEHIQKTIAAAKTVLADINSTS